MVTVRKLEEALCGEVLVLLQQFPLQCLSAAFFRLQTPQLLLIPSLGQSWGLASSSLGSTAPALVLLSDDQRTDTVLSLLTWKNLL